MAFTPDYYKHLFNQLLQGQLSPEETDLIVNWLGTEEQDPKGADLILQQISKAVHPDEINPEIITALNARIPMILKKDNRRSSAPVRFLQTKWLRYAAVIVICFSVGAYIFNANKISKKSIAVQPVVPATDIQPGKNGAVLTLDNGKRVVLDSMGNGVVAMENGSKIMLKNGQLVYNADGAAGAEITFNTMTTQRGRQFQLVLPDGTKAWLNAASSIRYPTIFTGNERKVEVTGEVYFEVAKNAKKPFYVNVNNETTIKVLGTHFNVNSYKDEKNIATTLLEGSVEISSKGETTLLKPGQQAHTTGRAGIKVTSDVNMEKVMAWKNGVFNFQDATLKDVMRQLERWYDIEVVYEKNIPAIEFMGSMGRDLSLSEVLRGLEMSDVHFRIEAGRRVVVMP